jgi:hypothetical protein
MPALSQEIERSERTVMRLRTDLRHALTPIEKRILNAFNTRGRFQPARGMIFLEQVRAAAAGRRRDGLC